MTVMVVIFFVFSVCNIIELENVLWMSDSRRSKNVPCGLTLNSFVLLIDILSKVAK